MESVKYTICKKLEIIENADVVVVGGGPSGIGAAVMSARSGAKTLLIEQYSSLGGMATHGEVMPFMQNHVNGESLDRLVYPELVAEMKVFNPDNKTLKPAYKDKLITPYSMALAAENICLQAGVNILYHHTLTDVIKEERKIKNLVLYSKSGYSAVSGKVFIDCTGDGDLAVKSGCGYEMGNENGNCQPMTLCFKVSGVDVARMPIREEICKEYNNAKETGKIDCPREDVMYFVTFNDDVIHFNTTRIIKKNGTNGKDLSDAEKEGRRQIIEIFRFFKNNISGFENSELHSIASHIGVRETRRIIGIDYITKEVFLNRQKFPDSISKVNYMIDIHSPEGAGTELIRLKPDEWYEVPYGCIVARDMDNLLVGGRAVSTDRAINSSLRIMPCAISIGCACGVAASMSVKRSNYPSEISGIEVHYQLKKNGADL